MPDKHPHFLKIPAHLLNSPVSGSFTAASPIQKK